MIEKKKRTGEEQSKGRKKLTARGGGERTLYPNRFSLPFNLHPKFLNSSTLLSLSPFYNLLISLTWRFKQIKPIFKLSHPFLLSIMASYSTSYSNPDSLKELSSIIERTVSAGSGTTLLAYPLTASSLLILVVCSANLALCHRDLIYNDPFPCIMIVSKMPWIIYQSKL